MEIWRGEWEGLWGAHSSTSFSHSSFLSLSSSLFSSDPTTVLNFHSMAMQLPPTTLYAGRSSVVLPPTTPTLQRSSFLPYYSMRLLGNKKSLSKSSAPRFSMRVSSKQAYICRDCGSLSILISLSLFLVTSNIQSLFIYLLLFDFAGIFTMIELHLTSYLITISVQVSWFMFKESTSCSYH